jgi:hypothetical protein
MKWIKASKEQPPKRTCFLKIKIGKKTIRAVGSAYTTELCVVISHGSFKTYKNKNVQWLKEK